MLAPGFRLAHTLGVALKVVRFGASLFQHVGIGELHGAQCEDQFFDFPLWNRRF
jgi:hypothetical protein